jgi:hypothetical protein
MSSIIKKGERFIKTLHELNRLLIYHLAANGSAETPKQDALPRGRILVVDDNQMDLEKHSSITLLISKDLDSTE